MPLDSSSFERSPRKRRRIDSSPTQHLWAPSIPSSPQSIASCSSNPSYPETGTPLSFVNDCPDASGAQTPSSIVSKEGKSWVEVLQDERTPDNATKSASSPEMCFGMLSDVAFHPVKNVTSSVPPPFTSVAVRGRNVVLNASPTAVIGVVDSFVAEVYNKLSVENGLELQTYICPPRHEPRQSQRGRSHTLSVVIYGSELHSDAVAEFLDSCNMHLQDPKHCDRNVPYVNPQSLVQTAVMTRPEEVDIVQDFQAFSNPVDMLADVESDEQLPTTATPSALNKELFDHQKQALTFMKRRERGWAFGTTSRDIWQIQLSANGVVSYFNTISEEESLAPPPQFCGGVLADQMGLGKSLSAIALIASDRDEQQDQNTSRLTGRSRKTLLVVRAALLDTWIYQLQEHLLPGKLRYKVHHGRARVAEYAQLESADVVITTYHTLMAEFKKHQHVPQIMYTSRWHRVILDEAHDIRDANSTTARAMCELDANCRWALTRTPIQNRLSDLASLYKFLRVYPYDDPRVFSDHVASLCNNSTSGAEKLKELVKCVVLRRSIGKVELPDREDLVCRLVFEADEQAAYNRVESRTQEVLHQLPERSDTTIAQLNVLAWINKLLRICNLGINAFPSDSLDLNDTSVSTEAWTESKAQETFNSLVTAGEAFCEICCVDLGSVASEVADPTPGKAYHPLLSSCLQLICGLCLERKDNSFQCKHTPTCSATVVTTLSSSLGTNNIEKDAARSTLSSVEKVPTKIKALLKDIKIHAGEEKCIVFSFWTTTLDHIEAALEWHGIRSIRIDGSVTHQKRNAALKIFRTDSSVRVALLTLSCGAVGLDLTVASRAYLMEPHWNPSVEQQALARVYRIGQTRKVTTIRYIIQGSFEEHVLNVQSGKQQLSDFLFSKQGAGSKKTGSERIQHLQSFLQATSSSAASSVVRNHIVC